MSNALSIALLAVLLCSACVPHQPRSAALDLSGVWLAEFQSRSGAQASSGTVTLNVVNSDPSLCPDDASDCGSHVRGSHQIDFKPLLDRSVPSIAVAGVDPDGHIIILLGECCDQGEIGARGVLRNGAIRGRWVETFLGGGREGTFTFTLVRRP
jgi:hypothetical protein